MIKNYLAKESSHQRNVLKASRQWRWVSPLGQMASQQNSIKFFWNDVSTHLLASLNSSFSKGHLSISQRRGFITLIPKKNKPEQFLKNWGPISLLNCDYKIAAKAVATRMKRVLPDIINNDQTGFLKGRSISENVRLLNSVISYAEQQNVPGMLLFIDFEKAFIPWYGNLKKKT